MPLLTILGTFPETKKQRAQIGSIEISASIKEGHTREAEITDSPVESGFTVSDHRRVKPAALSIDGVVSSAGLTSRARVDENGNVTREPARLQGFTAEETYVLMQEMFEGLAVFDVVTSLRVYERMHFTRFYVNRDRSSGSAISFSADLRQIEVVTSSTVRVTNVDAPKAASTTKRGKQQTTEAPAGPAENASTAYRLGNGSARAILDAFQGP